MLLRPTVGCSPILWWYMRHTPCGCLCLRSSAQRWYCVDRIWNNSKRRTPWCVLWLCGLSESSCGPIFLKPFYSFQLAIPLHIPPGNDLLYALRRAFPRGSPLCFPPVWKRELTSISHGLATPWCTKNQFIGSSAMSCYPISNSLKMVNRIDDP